ncbi:uncharacterized protein LOC116292172 isoform X2 [Actinia tenebrosa]|uniref:Uncharacterized protein LOC116292172 isoform X2 n=1 Tax=Actinia tenebrosa TaxID=6105 RepID=A0A6P8HFV3_ACTTE|nr:uncharacterized protein LOC116292172 isoform X2 [Actinia tenebrosa]
MIDEHRKLSWHLNILVEEIQGLQMCTISMHNLLHIHEDIIRFSGTDNYWCAVFERAVKGYIKRSSNCKGIEKTFAFAESRREFLKPYTEKKDEVGKIDNKLGIASSVDTTKVAIDMKITPSTSLLLGAIGNISFLEEADRRKLANILSVPLHNVSEVAYISKKCLMADRSFDGTVFKSGETAVITINQLEVVVKLDIFLSLRVKGDESYQLLVKGHIHPYCTVNEEQAKHFWTGFVSVKNTPFGEAAFCNVSAIQRKVILYECDKERYTVVDYERQKQQLPFEVVVPVYPEKGDMLLIQGEDADDIWYGHACNIDYKKKLWMCVFFFVEHSRKRNIYIRETYGNRARNVVPWTSLIGVANGTWKSSSFVQWQKAFGFWLNQC